MSAAIAPATPQPAALRAGIDTGTGTRADTAAKDAAGPEAAESFRSLLARKARNGGGEGKPMREGKGEDEAASAPAPATAAPLALSPQTMGVPKHGSTPGPSDDKAGQALAPRLQRSGEAQVAPGLPVVGPQLPDGDHAWPPGRTEAPNLAAHPERSRRVSGDRQS